MFSIELFKCGRRPFILRSPVIAAFQSYYFTVTLPRRAARVIYNNTSPVLTLPIFLFVNLSTARGPIDSRDKSPGTSWEVADTMPGAMARGGHRRGQPVPRAPLQASLESGPIVKARPERFRPTHLPGHTMPDSSAETIIPLNMTDVDCTANGGFRNVLFQRTRRQFWKLLV